MNAEWLANVNGQEYGPYTWKQMLQMAAEGRVPADLPVKRVSDKKWFTAKQVPGLVRPAKPVAPAANPAPGRAAKDDSKLKRAKPLAAAANSVAPPPPSPPPPPPPPTAQAGALGLPVIVADARRAATSPSAATQPAVHVPRRRTSRLMLVGVLGSVAAAVLVAGGAVIWMVWLGGGAAALSDQVVAAAQQKAESGKRASRAPASSTSSGEAPDEKTEEASGSGPTKAELAAQAKTVKSISTWQSMAGVKSFGVSNASLHVTRVWRTESAGEKDKKSGGPYICVEVSIRNKSRSPLRYKGWNSYAESGAILADESNAVLPLVPVEKTPDLTRLTRTSIPGGGAVTELLVFDAPASEDEVLHLVLPYEVFYSNVRPPYRAIEVTPDVMGVDLTETAAATPPAADAARSPKVTAGAGPASTEPAEVEVPPTSSPGAKPATKDGKPASLRDMINSEPGAPARPDDPPAEKGKMETEKDGSKKGEKPQTPKKPENPFEPKGDNPLDPLSVVPKEEKKDEP